MTSLHPIIIIGIFWVLVGNVGLLYFKISDFKKRKSQIIQRQV